MDYTNAALKVVKTGADLFDTLHVLGLGTVLSFAYDTSINIRDEGGAFLVSYSKNTINNSENYFDELLPLPEYDEVKEYLVENSKMPGFPLYILNKLLQVGISSPGTRIIDVRELKPVRQVSLTHSSDVMEKAKRIRTRLTNFVSARAETLQNWVLLLEQDYSSENPQSPIGVTNRNSQDRVAVLLAIDPAFSYGRRSPFGDFGMWSKNRVSFNGTRFAVILSFIGASRFLRSFRLGNDCLGVAIFAPHDASIRYDEIIPDLHYRSAQIDVVLCNLVISFLSYQTSIVKRNNKWSSLFYQVIQNTRNSAPISIFRGGFNLLWMSNLSIKNYNMLIELWKLIASADTKRSEILHTTLLDLFSSTSSDLLVEHLKQLTFFRLRYLVSIKTYYPVALIRRVIAAMNSNTTLPSSLSIILSKRSGTVRFGQALRQVCRFNLSRGRDLIDDLDSIDNRDGLIRVIAEITHENYYIIGKSNPFAIVPMERDFKLLLEDIETFGVKTIAAILIALASLKFNTKEDS